MDNDVPPVGGERDSMIAVATGRYVWLASSSAPSAHVFIYPRSHPDFDAYPRATPEQLTTCERFSDWDISTPRYSIDLIAAFTLGEEAAQMGFAKEYVSLLAAEFGCSDEVDELFHVAHASADARSAAWLRAWREWKGREAT